MATATKPFEEMNTLWEILEAALEDVRKVEAMPDVVIDMGHWLGPIDQGGLCHACAAGAVMICRLGADKGSEAKPHDYGSRVRDRLLAIDSLRCGDVADAYWHIHAVYRSDLPIDSRYVNSYRLRDGFYADMDRLLADLKAANI